MIAYNQNLYTVEVCVYIVSNVAVLVVYVWFLGVKLHRRGVFCDVLWLDHFAFSSVFA